jgi:acyl-CoA thioesterase
MAKSRRYAHMEVFGGKVVAVAFLDALEEPEEDEG